jgi:hypothetical protein
MHLCSGAVLWAAGPNEPVKRARPPKWSQDVLDVFFEDAREKLVGTRPDYSERTAAVAATDSGSSTSGVAVDQAAGWSKLIDAETIETEIKRLGQSLAKDVTSPSEFKGGTYKECRRHFSVLAALFAVAAEFDEEVRWRDAAPALRDVFARAGRNCKVGTDQTFQEASQRKQDLAELVGGSRPALDGAGAEEPDWPQVADRPPLMQRLNIAQEERLKKWLASESEFSQQSEEVRHEAQLVAAIADIVGREGFEFWDDDQYAAYTRELRDAASELAAAVELDNYEKARDAGNRVTKACADCHDGYRG